MFVVTPEVNAAILGLFGQIPDTMEDVWVQVALKNDAEARQLIDRTSTARNLFNIKYSKVEDANWETCEQVLNPLNVKEHFSQQW